jgi:hypothetical protein
MVVTGKPYTHQGILYVVRRNSVSDREMPVDMIIVAATMLGLGSLGGSVGGFVGSLLGAIIGLAIGLTILRKPRKYAKNR